MGRVSSGTGLWEWVGRWRSALTPHHASDCPVLCILKKKNPQMCREKGLPSLHDFRKQRQELSHCHKVSFRTLLCTFHSLVLSPIHWFLLLCVSPSLQWQTHVCSLSSSLPFLTTSQLTNVHIDPISVLNYGVSSTRLNSRRATLIHVCLLERGYFNSLMRINVLPGLCWWAV